MKKHIMKLVAVVMTAVMVLSLVPVAALPEVNWPELLSVFGASSEQAGDSASSDASTTDTDTTAATSAPVTTLTSTDTEDVYTDAAGNVYVDADGDGVAELLNVDTATDDTDVSIDELLGSVEQGKVSGTDYNTETEALLETSTSADVYLMNTDIDEFTLDAMGGSYGEDGYVLTANGKKVHKADADTSAYEPKQTNNEDHPFLPNNDAWINLQPIFYGAPATPTYPFTKWSANTSFFTSSTEYMNDKDGNAIVKGWVFPDVDLISEQLWADTNYQNSFNDTTGIAYNRYDAMQDKWGVTLDKNIDDEYVEWDPNVKVTLSENPYLLYSTEQIDGQQLAIAIKIGTPNAESTSTGGYDYRWYTITDSINRPGIVQSDYNKAQSMEPNVKISAVGAADPVFADESVEIVADTDSSDSTGATEVIVSDTGYVDGAICACIDMVQWLPLVSDAAQVYDIDAVRVYTKTDSAQKQAARINYLYFVNQASNFLMPMSDTGLINVADEGKPLSSYIDENSNVYNPNKDDDFVSYNNGWVNAAAITTLDMTINNTYKLVIDTTDPTGKGLETCNKGQQVLVTLPIRKWSNVAWDARKLLLRLDSGDSRPTITIVGGHDNGYTGKDIDSLGWDNGTESILGIFGGMKSGEVVTPYSTNGALANGADLLYAKTQSFNGDATYYDWLECKYMDGEPMSKPITLKDGTATDETSYGWVYISSINIIVPVGTTMEIISFDTKNVSDSLNDAGNSLDGGAGVQPQVDVADDGYSWISEPAAYGPLLQKSTYTNQDLLPRYQDGNVGGTVLDQTIYGRLFEVKNGAEVYSVPGASVAGWFTGNKLDTRVYAQAEYGDRLYGLIYFGSDFWWIKIGKNVSDSGYIVNGDYGNYASSESHIGVYNWGTWNSTDTTADVLKVLRDKWVVSVIGTDASSETTDDDPSETFGKWDSTNGFFKFTGADRLKISSWYNGENVFKNTDDSFTGFKTINSTDTYLNTTGHASLTRVYSDPIEIHGAAQGGALASKLHYDITVKADAEKNLYFELALKDTADNIHNVWLKQNGSALEFSTSQVSITNVNSAFTGYIDLDSYVGWSIMAMRLYYGNGLEVTLRRFEVISEETDWQDEITTANGTVADGFNILDDAFHSEIMRSESNLQNILKDYGPKGWTVHASRQTGKGGSGEEADDYSLPVHYDPQLGHAVFKNVTPSNEESSKSTTTSAKFVLTSKYSWSSNEYRYLYLSVVLRDLATKVAAEEEWGHGIAVELVKDANNSTNKHTNGDAYFINQTALSSGTLSAVTKDWGMDYGANLYNSFNVAIDLQKVGLESFNQINFFFRNYNSGCNDAEFYINYCYLSNVQPDEIYTEEISRPYYQTYYLMDDTGDRYSTRFPTPSNPTGQVTSISGDAGRVNPMLVERGKRFYEGEYFNGYDVSTNDSAELDALKPTWFYDNDDIQAYYKCPGYTDTNGTVYGEGSMKWNYNRWIGDYATLTYDKASGNMAGNMLKMYATANNVLLRSGLEPRKYRTVFDTQGGQMSYEHSYSISTGTDGIFENENNIYNTETVVLSYYTWPATAGITLNPLKYGYKFEGWFIEPQNGRDAATTDVQEIYAYNRKQNPDIQYFYAWWTAETEGNDPISGKPWADLTHTARFLDLSGNEWNSWTVDKDSPDFSLRISNAFSLVDNGTPTTIIGWQAVKQGETKPALDEHTVIHTPGRTITITDDYDFYPVTRDAWSAVTGLKDAFYRPHKVTVVKGTLWAHKSNAAENEGWFEIKDGTLDGVTVVDSGDGVRTYYGLPHYIIVRVLKDSTATIDDTDSGWVATYENLTDDGNKAYSYLNTYNNSGSKGNMYNFTVASYYAEGTDVQAGGLGIYQFSVYTDVKLEYADLSHRVASWTDHEMCDDRGAMIWTTPETFKQNRQMLFISQFELPEGATWVQSGTLYTKSNKLADMGVTNVNDNAQVAQILGEKMRFIDANGDVVDKNTNITAFGATKTSHGDLKLRSEVRCMITSEGALNRSNQFGYMVTINNDKSATYLCRGYVIYKLNGVHYIVYSDIIAQSTIEVASALAE